MSSISNIVITKINEIRDVYFPKEDIRSVTNRPNYGLSFCQSGKIVYRYGEKQFVSDPSHAVLHPMGGCYKIYGSETGYFPLVDFSCTEDFEAKDIMMFSLRNPESYLKDYEKLKQLMLFPQNNLRMMEIMYQILNRLFMEGTGEKDILEPAMIYLEENYMDPTLTNAILAEKAFISETYFLRLFRKRFGVSPRKYLCDIRIRKAKQLLIGTNYTISSVAQDCGFSDITHFSRAFRGMTGETPMQYRKRDCMWDV